VAEPAVIKKLVDEFCKRKPMRATSLIVTLFGDMVSQHGDHIWLGSLVRALAPVGVNERLVRTSVFRLVQEGWLEFERVGRRSYYRLSDYGSHEYQRAARRIYALDKEPWNGRWHLLLPGSVPEELREKFRRSLHWQGFRPVSPGVFAKPGQGGSALQETLAEFGLTGAIIQMEADTLPETPDSLLADMVEENWHLQEVGQRYREFLSRFKPLARWLRTHKAPEPEAAFVARTLLIHDYRRVLLQDTRVPAALLPPRWPGLEAEQLTAAVYSALKGASLAFISSELEGGNGALQNVIPDFHKRFA
jgi:phenylacetic acid degradation operon negative regulatory protein